MSDAYAAAGVDTAAGDLAVELMKSAVRRTHGPEVLGGVGGFAGLFDASALPPYDRPLLATSTDGVGTKVAIAQAIDKHDTIGLDLVGMVVDDIVVVGAKPLFMTDYIACGKVFPERIADIVARHRRRLRRDRHRARRRRDRGAPGPARHQRLRRRGRRHRRRRGRPHPRRRSRARGRCRARLGSSGLHSNGYSLVRHIVAARRHPVRRQRRRLRHDVGRGAARADPPVHRAAAAAHRAAPAAACTRSAT